MKHDKHSGIKTYTELYKVRINLANSFQYCYYINQTIHFRRGKTSHNFQKKNFNKNPLN